MQEQMNDMRKKGIIVESSSSWLAPAVYTRKKTDCVWTTVKQTRGQERTHDRLSGANVFSKLDFQCGTGKYQWTQEKTAFSPGPGMSSKVEVVVNWPRPKDEAEVRRFLGLASYYCKYIDKFADIAAPLHQLTQKDTPFQWTQKSEESFQRLKACLTEAPVLAYPQFDKHASAMVLQTDASNVGLGAVLEQDQRVVGYASRTLTKAEANYSVIQRECLAIVWAMKQFRHYLLAFPTNDGPCSPEFSFEIMYRKGTTNGNADALSRRRGPDRETLHAALTTMHAGFTAEVIRQAQQQDKTTLQLKYHPGPTTSDTLVVPVLPHQQALSMCHDSQAAGHQGTHKTLERIRWEAYWVNMAQDVDRHCRECVTCQKSKLPMPGDGMVERFNRSLLQLLRTYVEKQEDWEQHLPLALTAAKMAELQDLVAAHILESAHRQKVDDDRHSAERPFKPGDLVWLSVPTAGKLDLRWEGNWTVRGVKSPVTVEISDGDRTKVVHTNRLHIRIQPAVNSQPGIVPNPATPANSSACACSHGSHQE
eukprot:Em0008g17a